MDLAKEYSRVTVSLAAGSTAAQALAAAATGKVNRLHALHVTIQSTTIETALIQSGGNTLASFSPTAGTPLGIPFDARLDACLNTTTGAALNLSTTAAVTGYAVVSASTA